MQWFYDVELALIVEVVSMCLGCPEPNERLHSTVNLLSLRSSYKRVQSWAESCLLLQTHPITSLHAGTTTIQPPSAITTPLAPHHQRHETCRHSPNTTQCTWHRTSSLIRRHCVPDAYACLELDRVVALLAHSAYNRLTYDSDLGLRAT